MIKLKIKPLSPNYKTPTRASAGSAGLDLYCPVEIRIPAGGEVLIPLGFAAEIPLGYVGLIYARSGLSIKEGIVMKNAVGVIDCDYRGEMAVALKNTRDGSYKLEKHQRIAQLVVTPYLECEIEESLTLDETCRGDGGFGSSGKK